MDKPLVLVVDDDSLSRSLVASKLALYGADVVEAVDGIEAVAVLKSQAVDLVVADLEMPRLSGYDLLACIRGMPSLKHLPVIVLTAKESRGAIEQALIHGATSFLVKPLNSTAFGEHIKHLLALAKVMRAHRRAAQVGVRAA